MTVTDHSRRARKFEHIAGQSSYLAPVLEQTRRVAAAGSIVFSRENRGKVRGAGFRAVPPAPFLLLATVVLAAGCGSPKAAPSIPSPEVEAATVIEKDVPIYSEWVATLDGYVNAQIQPQVTGYVIRQTYKEGSFVHKGQILFQIDPRPFQALLDQANAQLAQAQAQLGKTQMDVDRDTPLAKERAIAQSQLDNDVQANRAAQAVVEAAEAQVEQAKLNLEFTDVKSLVDGISGIAQVQIGNLVNPTTVLTSVSGAWSFGASLAQPIFTGGRLRSQVRLAEAQQQTAALFYQQSIQEAFRSVSDALVAYRKTREFRAQQELLFESAEDAARLSHMRYTGGATGYLEVLTNETNAFSAELGLVQARLNELQALVQLYEALGGGWQQ